MENPFEAFDLDPLAEPEAITEALRARAERASPEERARIREAWQALTLHPAKRLEAALAAHPETRVALGKPPPAPRAGTIPVAPREELGALAPSVKEALGGAGDVLGLEAAGPLEEDPVLR